MQAYQGKAYEQWIVEFSWHAWHHCTQKAFLLVAASVNGNASDFTDIVVTFNCNAITVGGAGHDHMLMSIHLGHCDLEAEVLASLCA